MKSIGYWSTMMGLAAVLSNLSGCANTSSSTTGEIGLLDQPADYCVTVNSSVGSSKGNSNQLPSGPFVRVNAQGVKGDAEFNSKVKRLMTAHDGASLLRLDPQKDNAEDKSLNWQTQPNFPFPLQDGCDIKIVKKSVTHDEFGDLSYVGRVNAVADSQVVWLLDEDGVTGTIHLVTGVWSIESLGKNGLHILYEKEAMPEAHPNP